MRINNSVVDRTGETAAEFQSSGKSSGFENVKNVIADKLHNVAVALGGEATAQDAQSGATHYGKHAAELLDQSAEYVRQFDYEQVDARVQEHVRHSPGRSLLIAGAVGLIIGAILKRK